MQNTPGHKLPRWFSFVIAAAFLGHFLIITVYHFSRHILPEKLWFYTEYYVSPWFYQHFVAFAPEPPMESRRFLYRWKDEHGWCRWQYPAHKHLLDHWSAPWGPSSEMHDMLQAVADNLYKSAKRMGRPTLDTSVNWMSFPAMRSAQRYIGLASISHSLPIDSFQAGIWIEKYVLHNDTMSTRDSFIVFPQYSMHE